MPVSRSCHAHLQCYRVCAGQDRNLRNAGGGVLCLLSSVFCLLPSVLWAATPPNTAITNTARATYDIGSVAITVSGAVTVTTAAQTPALVEFLRYAPGIGVSTIVQPTISNGTTLPPPVFGTTTLTVPSALPLIHTTTYSSGEPVFIKVTDYDRNQNSSQLDTLSIVIRTLEGGEFENLVLTETGSDTGVFVGYVQSQQGEAPASSTERFIGFPQTPLSPAAINNGTLNTYSNAQISATYQDGINGNTSIAAVVLIDPVGMLFDAATGAPVNGVQVTLLNVTTNLPAIVFGADGVSLYPSTVITGGSVTDASGLVYNFAPGAYQFPFVAAGTYRFEVIPPTGFSFPSTVPNTTLQTLPGAPYALGVGSRGENFPLADGPPLRIDIPLNSANGSLQITKSTGKATVAIGDYVPYTLSLRNPNPLSVNGVQIADRLPPGFRYQAGTARLDGAVLADPAIAADDRTLTFSIGTITTGTTVNVKYVVSVVAGAQTGPAVNSAQTVGVASNTARATVLVLEDLNHSRAILMGRVIVGSCDDTVENDNVGLANARIVLQDGTYILTDKEGRWHADNIRPGTHVVQLDLDSLPKDYKVVACENNSRFAGRNYSQFVNVRGGSLWRADFYVKKIAPPVTIVKPIAQCAPVITPPPVFEKSTFSADKIFAFGSATLNATGIVSLDEFLDKKRGVNFQSITLIGHTDPLGSETYNLTLSLKRAAAVRDYFVRNGLDAKLIEIGGTGKSEPIKPLAECTGTKGNALSECLAPNRRIEVHVTILIPAAPLPPQTDCQVPERHSKADATAAQPEVIAADSPPVINESKPLGGNVVSGNITGDTNLKNAADGTPIMKQVTAQSQHSLQLVEKLDYDEKWLVTATPGIEWLHPRESFQPALPAIKIAVKHLPGQRVEMKVNGERVNPLYFDGTTTNAAVNLGLSLWRGVTIKEGDNLVEMTVLDTKGAAAGFVAVTNSPQATGATTAGTRITVFWARATSAAMTAPTVADPGDHVFAQILTYRGVISTGNPWDVTGGGVKAVASTLVTVTSVTTTVDNTLIVQATARDVTGTGAMFSAQTNAGLTGITEQSDAGTALGNGGGFAVWDGVKATAGATGNTTATVTSSINAFLTIALRPPVPTLSSAANQSFTIGDPPTLASTLTVTDASTPTITATNDLRIRIPATFNMTWDTAVTTVTLGGGAAGKVSATLSAYEDSNKTAVLNVTTNFAASDQLVIPPEISGS